MNYDMEQLMSLVTKLVEKYTSLESTSVTYDKANQLMGAVLYCINESEKANSLCALKDMNAALAYENGYEILLEKMKRTQQKFYDMMKYFEHWDNENYRDTVCKAIPGFFRYYDPKFYPQNTIITMDYPILTSITECGGIDAVEQYVDAICLEQIFFSQLPTDYIKNILLSYQKDYEKHFFNLCRVVLRHLLGCMLIGKNKAAAGDAGEYEKLKEMINKDEVGDLECCLKKMLAVLIRSQYENNDTLMCYLLCDIHDFAFDLYMGAKNHCLEQIVVL